MWSYYGSKSKIVQYYPIPKHDLIIEPFAGSARYALRYSDKEVILNDLDENIVKVWEYLIKVKSDEIFNLPELVKGDKLDMFNLTDSQRRLMSFMVGYSTTGKRNTYTGRAARDNEIRRCKNRILANLDKIRHWNIKNTHYETLPDVEASWYVDPPYQNGGKYYKHNKVDYLRLAEWCKSRKGQVIVCENNFASWLPFRPLKVMQGGIRKSLEMIWTND